MIAPKVKVTTVKGKDLDKIAFLYGISRKRYWWIFKESDKKLKERIKQLVEWSV